MPEIFRTRQNVLPWESDGIRVLPPDLALYHEASSILKVWYVIQGNARDVIDFDLAGITSSKEVMILTQALRNEPYKYQKTVIIDALTELHDAALDLSVPEKDRHNLDFACAQINASLWYARKLRGDDLDNLDYIRNSQGVEEPKEVSPEIIDYQIGQVEKARSEAGITTDTIVDFQDWRKIHEIDQEEAQKELTDAITSAFEKRSKFLGYKGAPPFGVKPVYVNAYYYVWIDTDKKTGSFTMQQNFGDIERPKVWTSGKTEELGWHEGGQHLSRMARRQQLIGRELPAFFGLTTVHGPEQIIEEGLGQTITLLVPGAYDSLSPEGKFHVQNTILRSLVYGNAHLRINTDPDFSKGDFIKYVTKHLPWEPIDEIEEQIIERTKNPLKQAYLWAYAEGAKVFLVLNNILSGRGAKTLLKELDSKPFISSQLLSLANRLMKDRKNVRVRMSDWAYSEFDLMIKNIEPNQLHNI